MKCTVVCQRIEDYLENRLGWYERQSFERHVASCPSCSDELRSCTELDQLLWLSLSGSVQHRILTPEASTRMIQEVQTSVRRAVWAGHVGGVLRLVLSTGALALVAVGLFVLLGQIPIPSEVGPVSLLPAKRLVLSAQRSLTVSPVGDPTLYVSGTGVASSEHEPSLSLSRSNHLLEPQPLLPGQAFTVTVLLNSDLVQPLDRARFDLDISGPTGSFHFPLVVEGPLPAHGISVLSVSSQMLDAPCQEKYLIAPPDIFADAGRYVIRVTLYRHVTLARK